MSFIIVYAISSATVLDSGNVRLATKERINQGFENELSESIYLIKNTSRRS